MPSREDVDSQINLLRIHRRNIQAHLGTAGKYGQAIPSHIVLALQDERDSVNRIKNILKQWGVDVQDHVDDTAPVYAEPEKTAIPQGAKVSIEFENATKILVMPNAVFAVFKMAMMKDYGVDITEFVVAE